VKRPLQIVDAVGCGDAFVGGIQTDRLLLFIIHIYLGFLAYLSLNRSIDDCINAACYCAYECLSQIGCQFQNNPSLDETQRFREMKSSY